MKKLLIAVLVMAGCLTSFADGGWRETLAILALGLCAFCVGSAGVSAVPMAVRVSNKVALADDSSNYMQAMGPNFSGVIGSAVVAGILYTLCR